jgi:hypothetical protein
VIDSAIPDGWYEDPAKPDMQRWWADNAWTEHVRYAEKKRVRSAAFSPVALAGVDERFAIADDRPFYVDRPVTIATPAVVERPFYEERAVVEEAPVIVPAPSLSIPALSIVEQPAFEIPAATAGAPRLDNFYVPMARFQPHPIESTTILPQRRRGRAIALWVAAVALIGASAGVALWVFLPH